MNYFKCAFLTLICLSLSITVFARDTGMHSIFIGNSGDPAIWSYAGETGPEHWASLSSDYADCAKDGQSPVNLTRTVLADLPPLNFHYFTSTLSLRHNPIALTVDYDSGSYLEVGKRRYDFIGLEFHIPGEHMLLGQVADMEIHLRHIGLDGKTLIVAMPVETGHRKNHTLARILEHVPGGFGNFADRYTGYNAMFLLPADRTYFAYQGSETRPPCTPDVTWIVLQNPVKASREEVELLQSFLSTNARPMQPLNDRVILQQR